MRDLSKDPDTVKQASGILQRILHEEPEFWPYGLHVDQFDGGLYLLSKQAGAADYVGFVGWQEREEAGKRVGYYAIGVLPEYRRQGLAKAAVQKIIAEKSASVDEVRALVMAHNEPSQALARSIPGVHLTVFEKLASLQKSAFSPKQQALTAILGGLGSAALFDQTADPEHRTLESTFKPWEWDKKRALMGTFNALLGAGGAHQLRAGTINNNPTQAGVGIASILSAPAKDLMLRGQATLNSADPLITAAIEAAKRPPSKSVADLVTKPMLYGALGVGAGALGLGALASWQKARAAKEQAEAARGGRVKVTLPTKDPNDAETLLDIPIEEMNLSKALRARLSRDTRRKLYEETRKRTKHRKPKDPSKPTEAEVEDLQLQNEEESLDKAAAGAQPAVPSPPGPGNPALRQTQQQAAANSIDTSTAANPQIMKAQQDAASADMQAQQQVAQAEQQTQQQLMDQQQGFQQELQRADQAKQQVVQENQVLKMKLEQSKVEADLVKAKVQAKEELAKVKGDAESNAGSTKNDQLNQLIGSRLQRVQRNVTKSASDENPFGIEVDTVRRPVKPWQVDPVTGVRPQGHDLDPTTGQPKPQPIKPLRADAAQQINDNGFEYMAQGRNPGIHLYRSSYGGIGDMLYNFLLRPVLTTPPARDQELSVLGDMRRFGSQFMNQPRF